MTDVLIFKPRNKIEHEKNLEDFIEFGRKIAPLNDKYDYDSHYWQGVGNFTIFGANSRQKNSEELMDESLLPFAKAYVVYGGGTKAGLDVKLKALRAINASCLKQYGKGQVDVTKLCGRDFNNAVKVIKDSLGRGAAYQAGRGLANLLKFLIENKLISPFQWKNPIKKPADQATGDEADKRRQDKMPDDNALMALAEISAQKDEDLSARDIFTCSTMTLLLAAPNRGSEPLYLRHNCLHSERMTAQKALDLGLSIEDVKELLIAKDKANQGSDNTVVFNELGEELLELPKTTVDSAKDTELDLQAEIEVKGIKWYSGKGYGHANKWMPTVMYSIVEVAIERLSKQSDEARCFAKMLEDSPDFPRHNLCPNVPEDQLLTMDEAALALGLDLSIYGTNKKQKRTSRNALLSRKGIDRKDYLVCLRDLNKVVRNALPKGFPYIPFDTGNGNVKVKWSESLYTGFRNSLDLRKASIHTELAIPILDTLNEDLAPTKKINRSTGNKLENTLSVFQRWGYGGLIMTSHQLRHLLDTMAAVNGMSGEIRAKWAMRGDPTHNRYYDHTTPEEYGSDFSEDCENEVSSKEKANKSGGSNGKIQVQVATPRTLQELNTKASLTAHTTEFGMCIASYLSEPCTKYRDCINCNEHVCEKGDDGKCDRIRQRLKNEKKLLKKDKRAVDDGVQGALQWYERRKLTTERCERLIAMMEDPNIENGSLIKLANVEEVSLLDRAMDANGKKRLPKIENFQRNKGSNAATVDELLGVENKTKINEQSTESDELIDDLNVLEQLDDLDFFED